MNKIYTKEQVARLLMNPNVETIRYSSRIEYTEEFKKWAVMERVNHPELSAIQIFEKAGFTRDIISSDSAGDRLRYWTNKYLNTININTFEIKEEVEEEVEDELEEETTEDSIYEIFINKIDRLIELLKRK